MSKSMLPFEEVAAETFPKEAEPPPVTVTLSYEHAKPFLSNKPLRRPARTRLDDPELDEADVAAAREAMKEHGSISLEDLERELGF